MPKPNYAFAKRQRDLAKRKKQEEKRQRKTEARVQDSDAPDEATASESSKAAD